MALVASVENLTITITGTNTTGTGTLTLEQDSAQCVPLEASFMGPNQATHGFNVRDVAITISGTTVTATRSTGTDIGTITINCPIVEFDAGIHVETGEATIAASSTSVSPTLTTELTDIEFAFVTFSSKTTNTGDTFSNVRCRGEISSSSTLTFTRVGTSNTIVNRFYVVECYAEEFIVQRGTETIASSAEDQTETLGTTIVLAESFVISSYSGAALNDLRDCVPWVDVTDTTTLGFHRGRGGSCGANTLPIHWQVISLKGGQVVDHGQVDITTTSDTDTITAVSDVDMSTVIPTVLFGSGEGNSTTGSNLSVANCYFVLTNSTTVTGSITADIAISTTHGFAVVDWTEVGGTVDGGHSYSATSSLDIANSSVTVIAPITMAATSTATIANSGVTIIAPATMDGSSTLAVADASVTIIAGETAVAGTSTFAIADGGVTIVAGEEEITGTSTFAITDFSVGGGTVDGSHSYAATSTMEIAAAGVTVMAPVAFSVAAPTFSISATVADPEAPVTSLQKFGRFVVVDASNLGELALRKIAYVRQRER